MVFLLNPEACSFAINKSARPNRQISFIDFWKTISDIYSKVYDFEFLLNRFSYVRALQEQL